MPLDPLAHAAAAQNGEAAAFGFRLEARCPHTLARRGSFHTPHGAVATPAFMPVGTRASVKGVDPEQLRTAGSTMVLANTYHLHLRPGEELIAELGGLHRFMGWDGPLLTDSGGYQVFSLGHMTTISEDGARLRSVIDGARVEFTPERVVDIQRALGADVIMAFDHCPADPLDRASVEAATERTHRWLERCVRRFRETPPRHGPQALFGIAQGGAFEDLRRRSAEEIQRHDLVGYAIGGVSVGEHKDAMELAVRAAAPWLPEDKPRYLMGVGTPADFARAIAAGIDLFDCVTPTRHGRNHQAFVNGGKLNLRNAKFARDPAPLDGRCDCTTCTRFSRAYLRHLCSSKEMLAGTLLSIHNIRHFHRLMERVRQAIPAGEFPALFKELTATAG